MKFSTVTKKIASLAASAAIVASIVAVNAFAAGTYNITADKTTVNPGDEVKVTVNIDGSFNTIEYQLDSPLTIEKNGRKSSNYNDKIADIEATDALVDNKGHAAGAATPADGGAIEYTGDLYTYTVTIPADAKAGDTYEFKFTSALIDKAEVSTTPLTLTVASAESSSEADSSSVPDSSSEAPVVSTPDSSSEAVSSVVDSSSTTSSVADSKTDSTASKADSSSKANASSTTAPVKNNNTNSTANKTTNPSTGAAASATVAVAALAGAAVVVAKKRK